MHIAAYYAFKRNTRNERIYWKVIHQYKNNGYNIVMDVNSGSVHIVDDVVYDVIPLAEQLVSGGIRDVDTVTAAVEACQKLTYSHDEVREAVEEILELAQDNVLFTEDIYEKKIYRQFQTAPDSSKGFVPAHCP